MDEISRQDQHCPLQAVRTATNAQSSGDCGRIMIVLLTDGRANVSLAKSNEEPDAIAEGAPKPSQEQLKTEVLDMAKRCGSSSFNLLVIDTENKVCTHLLYSKDTSGSRIIRSQPAYCCILGGLYEYGLQYVSCFSSQAT